MYVHEQDPVFPLTVPAPPSMRVLMQKMLPSSPVLLKSDEATHASGLHTAVSVRIPAAHDLVPDRVYPVLHVGAHVEPLARVFGQGDALPKLMGSAASLHGSAEH